MKPTTTTTTTTTTVVIVVAVLAIALLFYRRDIYSFLIDPSWHRFKKWYSDRVNNVWGTVAYSLLFAAIVPESDLFKRFLIGLGLSYITSVIILGNPGFEADREKTIGESLSSLIAMTAVAFYLLLEIYSKLQRQR